MPTHPIPPCSGHRQDGEIADGGDTPPVDDAALAPRAPGKAAPLLDLGVLRDMERDFAGTTVVASFARDFTATLTKKIDRLDGRLHDRDTTGAGDAVLSLTTSAAMVGAERLTQAAQATRRFIGKGDLDAALRSVAVLRACAAETVRELQERYLDQQ